MKKIFLFLAILLPFCSSIALASGYQDVNISGNSATATALAANGSNCAAGQAAGGVSASGVAEDCTVYATSVQGGKADTALQAEVDPIVAAQANGFTITRGTTPKTLTVALDASVAGSNTGDQTDISGNAATVTNGVYTTGAGTVFLAPAGDGASLTNVIHSEVDPIVSTQANGFTITRGTTPKTLTVALDASVSGSNTGDQTNISGNAATVTTNANLTGGVTSVGNAATVVTNANLTGDVTSVGNASTLVEWATGNITYVPLTGSIATYITNATAGDTLVLASGTYTVTDDIDVTKAVNIVGQGIWKGTGAGTNIACATANKLPFDISASNVRIANLSINATGGGTRCINTSVNLSGLVFENLDLNASGAGVNRAIQLSGVNATVKNVTSVISSSDNLARGLISVNDSTVTQDSVVNVFDSFIDCTGVGNSEPAIVNNSNDANILTMNLYNTTLIARAGGAADYAINVSSTTTSNAVANLYNCVLNGDDKDVVQNGTNVLTLYNRTLVNNTTSGTITYGGNPWVAFTPTLVWGTADPASVTKVGRYTVRDKTVNFTIYITSADGNAASSLTSTLPIKATDVNSYTSCASHQLVDATWTDPLAYVDQLDDTEGNRILKFRNFSACTDTKTCTFGISGQYEI